MPDSFDLLDWLRETCADSEFDVAGFYLLGTAVWETVEVVLSPAMKVAVDMKSIELNLGNTGIVLYVYDNANKYVGKLRVGQATVEWCKGKVPIGKGKKVTLEKFIAEHLNVL